MALVGILFCLLFCRFPSVRAQDGPKSGSIEIASKPASAQVYVEGFLAGETPCSLEKLPPATYRLVIKKSSYADFIEDVQVTLGESKKVEALLKSDSGAPHSVIRAEDDWTPVEKSDQKKYRKGSGVKPFRDYKVLEVDNFLVKSAQELPPDILYSLFGKLARRLDEKTDFARFVTNYTQGPSPKWLECTTVSDKPTLVLTGFITRYQPLDPIKSSLPVSWRLPLGSDDGKTRIDCLVRFEDKMTKEVILELMASGSATFSFIHDAGTEATKRLVREIVKVARENW